jgi:hypothetical protein
MKGERDGRKLGSQFPLQRHAPNVLKPPTRPHLLKVPPPSRAASGGPSPNAKSFQTLYSCISNLPTSVPSHADTQMPANLRGAQNGAVTLEGTPAEGGEFEDMTPLSLGPFKGKGTQATLHGQLILVMVTMSAHGSAQGHPGL